MIPLVSQSGKKMAENEPIETEKTPEAENGPSPSVQEESPIQTETQPDASAPQEKPDPVAEAETPPSREEKVRDILISNLDIRRLIELDACTRCGECLTWCPVYDQDAKESIIPRTKVTDFLRIIRSQQGLIGRIVQSEKGPDGLKKLIATVFGYKEVTDAQVQDFVRNLY